MKPAEIHPQQARENPEPQERMNPVPWFVIGLTAALLAFGAIYIARSDLRGAPDWGDGRSASELRGAAPVAAAGAADGAAIYQSRCAACHQASGAGLPGVFPPLAGSEWVTGPEAALVAIVLHGATGAITVKGSVYNGAMPAFGAQLPDAELAAVLTHIRRQWGNAAAPVSADAVAAVRKATAARSEPFKGDAELASLR